MSPTQGDAGVWRWGRWTNGPKHPTPGTEIPGVRFLQFNVCGSARHEGSVVKLTDVIRKPMVGFQPDVAIFNEICLGQADALWNELSASGLYRCAYFGATTGRSRCPGEEGERWFGNAVFCRGPGLGTPQQIALPNPVGLAEQRSILSSQVEIREVRAVVSATHLVPRSRNEQYNRLQITEVARYHNERASQGEVVVFGGDFNATPDHLYEITPPAGQFQDVAHSRNRATYSRHKIDYIFLSTSYFTLLTSRAVKSGASDHKLLTGEATLKVGQRNRGSPG